MRQISWRTISGGTFNTADDEPQFHNQPSGTLIQDITALFVPALGALGQCITIPVYFRVATVITMTIGDASDPGAGGYGVQFKIGGTVMPMITAPGTVTYNFPALRCAYEVTVNRAQGQISVLGMTDQTDLAPGGVGATLSTTPAVPA